MRLDPENFPIDKDLPEILKSLDKDPCILIKAETGAGKTTRLPPFLVGKMSGKILVLEPRRLAAKLSAQRCAETLQTKIGDIVGHHIRFDKNQSSTTELLFITEGLFLPYLKESPTLRDYQVIILDEFHERSIHTDIALALIKRLQQTTRPDLKLIVMSATLDTTSLEKYLDSPHIFNIKGRTFPINLEYRDLDTEKAILQMMERDISFKNILVFLPGVGEIKSLQAKLESILPNDIKVVPLYSSLQKKDQTKAFTEGHKKIILSTNIAETSLTIPNVTGVIDTGTERRASFAPWSGMPLLQLKKISKASATQRAGRAGRVREGLVYRLYNERDFHQRENFTPSEVSRVELSHYVLDLIDLGVDPYGLDWFEAPSESNLKKALGLLEMLNATTKEKITKKGQFLAKLPLHPRLSSILYHYLNQETLLAVSILNEGMALSKQAQFFDEDEECCDLSIQMDLVKSYYWKDKGLSDYHHHFLDKKAARRILDLYQSLSKKFHLSQDLPKVRTKREHITEALLYGFLDRVAIKKEMSKKSKRLPSYNFCLGRGGKFSKSSALNSTNPDFIIVLDAIEDPKANASIGTTIQAASKVTKKQLLKANNDFLSTETETNFNEKKGNITLSTIKKYGKLTLLKETKPPIVPKGRDLVGLMKDNWPWPFKDESSLKLYHSKVEQLNKIKIEHDCPIFEGEMLELLIESCVDEDTSFQEIEEMGLQKLIYEQLSSHDQYFLESHTPDVITLSNGKSFKVSYIGDNPFIEARIQDLYSVVNHPKIANDLIPLTIHLLSPADRVSQIVSDLPRFWDTSWNTLKNELKSRYPKHFWPEDPKTAPPKRLKKDLL